MLPGTVLHTDKTGRSRSVGILTIDDEAFFRAAARAVVRATRGFEPLAEAQSGEEGIILAGRLQPDMVLLDVLMPGMDGMETSRRLLEASPDLVVVLVSAFDDPTFVEAASSCGAATFLRKQDLRPATLRDLWDQYGRVPRSHGESWTT
jgi:two-component system, NarL family, invasion response regulator UvrY